MPKIRVWSKITDLGDGSSSVSLYPNKALAREGLDDDDFEAGGEVPCEIDSTVFDAADCEIVD